MTSLTDGLFLTGFVYADILSVSFNPCETILERLCRIVFERNHHSACLIDIAIFSVSLYFRQAIKAVSYITTV